MTHPTNPAVNNNSTAHPGGMTAQASLRSLRKLGCKRGHDACGRNYQ
jgi:hypothetical protein